MSSKMGQQTQFSRSRSRLDTLLDLQYSFRKTLLPDLLFGAIIRRIPPEKLLLSLLLRYISSF